LYAQEAGWSDDTILSWVAREKKPKLKKQTPRSAGMGTLSTDQTRLDEDEVYRQTPSDGLPLPSSINLKKALTHDEYTILDQLSPEKLARHGLNHMHLRMILFSWLLRIQPDEDVFIN
jgi:hypothetical protein